MSGHCADCGNTLCICDDLLDRCEIIGTPEFSEKYIFVEKAELTTLRGRVKELEGELLNEAHAFNSLCALRDDQTDEIIRLQAQNKIMKAFVEMVEDHTKMPHQHHDAQTRLCCLTERAHEVLGKIKQEKSE